MARFIRKGFLEVGFWRIAFFDHSHLPLRPTDLRQSSLRPIVENMCPFLN
jgi:hypothetical protein